MRFSNPIFRGKLSMDHLKDLAVAPPVGLEPATSGDITRLPRKLPLFLRVRLVATLNFFCISARIVYVEVF